MYRHLHPSSYYSHDSVQDLSSCEQLKSPLLVWESVALARFFGDESASTKQKLTDNPRGTIVVGRSWLATAQIHQTEAVLTKHLVCVRWVASQSRCV